MPGFLLSGPANAQTTLLLAHGAGAPMDSDWMSAMAGKLAELGIRTARFEFAYMAARRSGQRKPPPRAETLLEEYRAAVGALEPSGRLLIGGKSLGGRVASMVADELFSAGRIAGLICLSYPFHPPGSPEKLRTMHLEHLGCPALICQGTRDPFGTENEVAGYPLSKSIAVRWFPGDHDIKPRKADGLKPGDNLVAVAEAVAGWAGGLG
jgi:predicted alpha/beta-hydrolase family hydrolase